MDEIIRKELEKEVPSEFHVALLKHCKNLVEMSRRHMCSFYSRWDKADDTYRGLRLPDKQDVQAAARSEPQRIVVPLTYAQTETFVSFCFSLFTQRERIFELVGTGEEDHKAAKVGEALLARDLTKNVFIARLRQFLLDLTKFGLGILKTQWVEETTMKEVEVLQGGMSIFGMQLKPPTPVKQMQSVVTFQGNKILNISPYHFFPDVRLPLSRFQEGEFVASEDDYSITTLYQLQKDGQIAGVDWIKPFSRGDLDVRRTTSRLAQSNTLSDVSSTLTASDQSTGNCVLTECQVKLIPSKFKIDEVPMGPEDYPVPYVVWYVNDKRIVKAEPMNYKHNLFTYDLAEFSPDMHNLVNAGLAETIDTIQAIISWLLNSHITSVRKVIQNHYVVDPAGIEMKDLVERSPVIRLKPDMARRGVDNFIKQLAVQDVTQNHMVDAQSLQTTMEIVTGINANALGQFHTGRRSATEARNVNSATASRLKMQATLIFATALEPMGRKMLSNFQQGLDTETFVRVMGEFADPAVYKAFKKVTKDDLVGEYDFEIFDGTLPSERGERAAALEEFMVAMMKNPVAVNMLGYDPMKMVEEWLELRGIRNPKRFLMDQVRQQQIAAMLQTNGGTNEQPNGQPGVAGAGANGNGSGAVGLLPPIAGGNPAGTIGAGAQSVIPALAQLIGQGGAGRA